MQYHHAEDDSGEISGPLVSLLAPPVHLPPSSTTANPAAGLPRSAMQTRQQGTASKYNVVTNPLAGLPPNTMQARTEPATSPRFLQTSLLASLRQGSLRFEEDRPEVATASTLMKTLCYSLLALIVVASLVAGGVAIASKRSDPLLSVDCTDPEGCDPEDVSILSRDFQVRDVAHPQSRLVGGVLGGYVRDEDVTQDEPVERPELEHSIESYLAHLELRKDADYVRQQGFEIKMTASEPLLEQPHTPNVETSNFKYDYVETWFKSLLMFEVQRGGTQASDKRTWRENDATAMDEATVGNTTQNMDGGWFAAGDHLKVTIPTGYVVARLAWTFEYYKKTLSKLRFEGGGTTSFGSAGSGQNQDIFGALSAYEWCKREVLWGATWLRKAAIISPDGQLEGIVVQCGLSTVDHNNVLNAERIEGGSNSRPCGVADVHRTATPDAAQLAAGLASASRMFSSGTSAEQAMSEDWMMAAKKALEYAATRTGGKTSWWQDAELYSTSMLEDHIFFAEASIFLASVATGDSEAAHTYFEAAMYSYSISTDLQNRCALKLANWDAPCALGMLMMVQGSGDFTSWFAIQLVRMFVDSHIGVEYSMTERMVGEGDITITPAGARFFSGASTSGQIWAPLRNLGEAASIAALVADFPGITPELQQRYRCLTASQVNYILGDTGRSFVVGVGEKWPRAPLSREGFCAMSWDVEQCNYNTWFTDLANPQIVVGAMVAGPNLQDQYIDTRENYQSTEIAIDFQSGLLSALTAAVTMPQEFWRDGDLSDLSASCDATGYRYYNWES